jgi:RNA polymerase sigma-70 factor (ECF subfamily)
MIGSMKNRQAEAGGVARTEPGSPDFEAAFAEHWGRVYRALYRLVGDPAEAEDLALETFVRLYRRPPLPGRDLNLGGWLYRVATNLGLQSLRKGKRRERYEMAAGRDDLADPPEDRPAELLEQAEQVRLARQALAQMNDRQAQLLTMRYSGLAYKEIAAALDLSPASIGPLLLRAEREFEKHYLALAKEDQ